VNLLRGDNLKITFNETGTSTLNIQTKDGEAINSAYLGLSSIEASDLDSDDNIDSVIATVGTSLDTIRSQSSSFGSNLSMVENRQDFTNEMINTLQTGADNLVLADTNEEGANMLALQTRQQLSSVALSLASQADQAVLQLF
jgi:flagellin-like hook-associated protein FlgL